MVFGSRETPVNFKYGWQGTVTDGSNELPNMSAFIPSTKQYLPKDCANFARTREI